MTTNSGFDLQQLIATNASAAFNRLIGLEVVAAGNVTASHFAMNCLRPAAGRRFIARGSTVRAGRKQVFAKAELFAENAQGEIVLVATGETVLVPLAA